MTLDDLSALVHPRYPRGAVSVERRGMSYVVSVHDGPPPTGRDVPWMVVARSTQLHLRHAIANVATILRGRAA